MQSRSSNGCHRACSLRHSQGIPSTCIIPRQPCHDVERVFYRYAIIKRRIAWLIGKWISSQCSSPNNPHVWEVLVHLLGDHGPGTDAVVRHTAASALRECIDVRHLLFTLLHQNSPYHRPLSSTSTSSCRCSQLLWLSCFG